MVYTKKVAAELRTYCRICEAACGLVVIPGNGARIVPDKEHPRSEGLVSQKACDSWTLLAILRASLTRGSRTPTAAGVKPRGAGGARRGVARSPGGRRSPRPRAVVYFGNPLAYNPLGAAALALLARSLGTRNVYCSGSQDCQTASLQAAESCSARRSCMGARLSSTPILRMPCIGTNPLVHPIELRPQPGWRTRAQSDARTRWGVRVHQSPPHRERETLGVSISRFAQGSGVWPCFCCAPRPCGSRTEREARGWLGRASRVVTGGDPPHRRRSNRNRCRRNRAPRPKDSLGEERRVPYVRGGQWGGYGTLAYVAVLALAHTCGSLQPWRGGSSSRPTRTLFERSSGGCRRSAPGARSRVGDSQASWARSPAVSSRRK